MLSLLLPLAFASTPSPGYFLPGATPIPTGDHGGGGVTVGGAAVCTYGCGFGVYAVGSVWGAMGPDNRLAGEAMVLRLDAAGDATVLGFTARYNAVQEERWSVAPWVGAALDLNGTAFGRVNESVYSAGVAVEYAWKRARFDASVPLLTVVASDPWVLYRTEDPQAALTWPLALSEVGVSLDAGGGHSLRFAKTAILPTMTWRMDKGWIWVEAGGGVWLLLNEVHAGVGVTF